MCRALFPLVLLACAGCQQTEISDVLSSHHTALETLNAENDVARLIERHQKAQERYDQYAPLVDAEEARLRTIRQDLKTARRSLAEVEAEKASCDAKLAAATKARDEAQKAQEAAEKATAALKEAQTKAEAEVAPRQEEIDRLLASKEALGQAAEDARGEIDVLRESNDQLQAALTELRDRARRLRQDHQELEALLRRIEKAESGG